MSIIILNTNKVSENEATDSLLIVNNIMVFVTLYIM